jgi:hypothetical protein
MSHPTYLQPFLELRWRAMRRRPAFATDPGFVGLGSSYGQKECVVAVLFGADVPSLLRPTEEEEGGSCCGLLCAFRYAGRADPTARWDWLGQAEQDPTAIN